LPRTLRILVTPLKGLGVRGYELLRTKPVLWFKVRLGIGSGSGQMSGEQMTCTHFGRGHRRGGRSDGLSTRETDCRVLTTNITTPSLSTVLIIPRNDQCYFSCRL